MHHHHDTECRHEVSAATKEHLLRELFRLLPAEALLHQPEELRPYECDGLSAYRKLPLAVALPKRVEQVQAILHLCHELEVPVVAFAEVVTAGTAVGDIIAAGIIPAGLEMMDKLAIEAAEDFVKAGYPRDAGAILLCELDGAEAEVSEQVLKVREILQQGGANEVRTAIDEAERIRFWAGRKNAFPAVGRISPDYYYMDGTWWGCEVEPNEGADSWYENEVGRYVRLGAGSSNPDWRQSLHRHCIQANYF